MASVAQTILDQLGSGKFAVMTGAKNFVGSANGLTFKLPGKNFCKNDINCVRVILDPTDTYTMQFLKIRGTKVTTVKEVTDVYNDQLQEIFTDVTGLDTSL